MVQLEAESHEERVQEPTKEDGSAEMKGTDKQVKTDKCDVALGPDASMQLSPGVSQQTSGLTVEVQQLFKRLHTLTQKQDKQFGGLNLPVVSRDDCTGSAERDSAVSSIRSMQKFYNFGSDTFADAVTYMDMFLSRVKVKRRYLSCVAAAAFFLSTKMSEESENHPSASQLCSLHRYVWKHTDLKRMEKLMLDMLGWNLFPSVSCLAFLKVIFDMLCLVHCDVDRYFFASVIERSELYLNYSRCAQYRPCTLAVAVFRECLKEDDLSSVVTNYTMLHIQAACQISDSELLDCQCAISRQLDQYNTRPSSLPPCLPLPRLNPRPNLVHKPSCYGTSDLPTIEEVSWNCELSEAEDMQQCYQPSRCKLVPAYSTCVLQPVPCYDLLPRQIAGSCVLWKPSFSDKIGSGYTNYKCNITKS